MEEDEKKLGVVDSFKELKDFPIISIKEIKEEKDLNTLKYPCYLKIDSYIHKKENGGVFFCDDKQSGIRAFYSIKEKFPNTKIISQNSIEGEQIVIGVKNDKVFGKIIMFGSGGNNLEKNDITFRTVKINRTQIKEMFQELKIYDFIKNYKYKEKLISLIEMTSFFSIHKNIDEMDLNPVILTNEGPVIVDARIKF